MSKRQDHWLKKGNTKQQIEMHLSWERYKCKQARERNKRHNEKNREIIKQIKKDLLKKSFFGTKKETTITKINETNDGVGFWWHCQINFEDGSGGSFRYFYRFDDYSLKEFLKDLDILI